jgi:muramidase (phage lysozyme)
VPKLTAEQCRAVLKSPRVRAFLRLIREGETSQGELAYRTIVGGGQFDSFADHPRQLVDLPKLGVKSTAAGAYQFLSRTWDGCRDALGLPDFGPESQDIAAVYLIDGRGALADVIKGDIEQAIGKCAHEWASLPGSPYGQPTMTLERALAVYRRWLAIEEGAQPQQDAPADEIEAAPIPAPKPAPQAHPWPFPPAGEADPTSPAIVADTEGTMPSFLIGLAQALLPGLAPLARDRIAKEMGRHTDPAAAEQIAQTMVDAAVKATGKRDPVEAVAAAKNSQVAIREVETDTLATLDRLAPLLDKVAEWDRQTWSAEEESRAAARKYSTDDPFMIDTKWLKLRFIHILSVAFVSFSGWFVTMNWGALTPELKGAVITLMIIAGWNGVRDYWMGSSRSSSAKDVVIGELSRRK